MTPIHPGVAKHADHFASTHWSVIAQAANLHSPEAKLALETLFRTYRGPLIAYIRRQVKSDTEAEDLTQSFFVHFLERNLAASADPSKGRFRAFLLTCCRNFVINERKRHAIETVNGTAFELTCDNTPERQFDREWALTVIRQALDALQDEYRSANNAELFSLLKPVLVFDDEARAYSDIASALGKSENAIKKAAQQARKRFREIIRASVAATLTTPDQIEEEIRELFSALSTS